MPAAETESPYRLTYCDGVRDVNWHSMFFFTAEGTFHFPSNYILVQNVRVKYWEDFYKTIYSEIVSLLLPSRFTTPVSPQPAQSSRLLQQKLLLVLIKLKKKNKIYSYWLNADFTSQKTDAVSFICPDIEIFHWICWWHFTNNKGCWYKPSHLEFYFNFNVTSQNALAGKKKNPILLKAFFLFSVKCHVSHVTCHVSHVTFFFRTKWWTLSVKGLLSTGPTPSSSCNYQDVLCSAMALWRCPVCDKYNF